MTSRIRYSIAPAPAAQVLVEQFAANHDVKPHGGTDLEMKFVLVVSRP